MKVGEAISDQIVGSVNNSRKTLILLSNDYVRSEWTKLEFKTATSLSRRVVVVMMEKLDNIHNLDQEFRLYLKLNKSIDANDKKFWAKLKKQL